MTATPAPTPPGAAATPDHGHTPGMLRVVGQTELLAVDSEVGIIADTHFWSTPPSAEQIANAHRLALCWNAHGPLVEALAGLLTAHGHDPRCLADFEIEPCKPFCSAARAALALARGETP